MLSSNFFTLRWPIRGFDFQEDTMADLFETIETCRAMRRLKPDPVPDEMIAKILRAGICAPISVAGRGKANWCKRRMSLSVWRTRRVP